MGDNANVVRLQALDIYLCCTRTASLRILQEVESEALLHQHQSYGGGLDHSWVILIANAKNMVEAVQRCFANCSSLELMTLSKAESAYLWSQRAVRTGNHEVQVYRNASSMMLKAQQCLSLALEAHSERDSELELLWISAAETLSADACMRVHTMVEFSEGTKKSGLRYADAIAVARDNAADYSAVGEVKTASRYRQQARLQSMASALHCSAQCGGDSNQFAAADQKAKLYKSCFQALTGLECTVRQLRAQKCHWAADLLTIFETQLNAALDGGEPSVEVGAHLTMLPIYEKNLIKVVWEEEYLLSCVENCTERAAYYENRCGPIAIAYKAAVQHTQAEIAALPRATEIIDFRSATLAKSRIDPTTEKSLGSQWEALASWMDKTHQAMTANDGRIANSTAEQERLCHSNHALILRQQLDFCSSLVTSRRDCLTVFQQHLSIMTAAQNTAAALSTTVAPLYYTAQLMRACAAEAPDCTAELTAAAEWFGRRAEGNAQQLHGFLAEATMHLRQAGIRSGQHRCANVLQHSHDRFCRLLRTRIDFSPCSLLRDPAAVLRMVNAVLTAVSRAHQRYAESLDVDPNSLPIMMQSAWEPYEEQRRKCIEGAALDGGANATVQQTALVFQATAAQLAHAIIAAPLKDWCAAFTTTMNRAASVCTSVAACLQCAIDSCSEGAPCLVCETTAALEAFRHVSLLTSAAVDTASASTSLLAQQTNKCREQLQATKDAEQRRLWHVALFYNLRATVAVTTGDTSQAAEILISKAMMHMQAAELTAMVPGFRAAGHNWAVDLCEQARQHIGAGGDVVPALSQHMTVAASHLRQLDAHRKHCQGESLSCKSPVLQKVWAHIADLCVFTASGVADRFAADPCALPFDLQSIANHAAMVSSQMKAAELLQSDICLLEFFRARRCTATQQPVSVIATAIQDLWCSAVLHLQQLDDLATRALTQTGGSADNVGDSEVKAARSDVHCKVRGYISIVHSFYQPAIDAQRRSTGAVEAELSAVWRQVAQDCEQLGRELADRTNGIQSASGLLLMFAERTAIVQSKLARARHFDAALRATDPRVRDAYLAACRHGCEECGYHGAEAARLHVAVAYHLERGVPEEQLQVLRAACMYAENGFQEHKWGFRSASHIAVNAHRLSSDQRDQVPLLLCAAKWVSVCDMHFGVPCSLEEPKQGLLHWASQLVVHHTTTRCFHHAAASLLLCLAGLERYVELAVDTSTLPAAVLPYITLYATAALERWELLQQSTNLRNCPWYDAAQAYRSVIVKTEEVVSMILLTTTGPTAEAVATLDNLQEVADLYKKAAFAHGAGNSVLCDCWYFAATTCDLPNGIQRFTPQYVDIAQQFAEAAEALQAGRVPLYQALLSAAQLRRRFAEASSLTKHQRAELRATEAAVNAARAAVAGRTRTSRWLRAANKLAGVARRVARAVGLPV